MLTDKGTLKRFPAIQSAQAKYVSANKMAIEALARAIDQAEVFE